MGFIGRTSKAKYKFQKLEEYRDNPFIEILGDISTEDEIEKAYTELPKKVEHTDEYTLIEQSHLIERVKNFKVPLVSGRKVAVKVSTMIRTGYLTREFKNEKEQLAVIRKLNEIEEELGKTNDVKKVTTALKKLGSSTAKSTLIVGVSGCGKTTAVHTALNLFDQVIIHEEYKGRPFTRKQLVYVKFDCSEDGSLSRLCRNFFEAVDEALGTNYTDKYALTTKNISELLFRMHRVAIEHAIGLLVIDEIQNIAICRDDKERMEVLNFIVGLSNNVGIPTIFIGTPEIYKLCDTRVAVIRRLISDEEIVFNRMEETSSEWESFITNLWEYQYLKTYTPLTDKLKALMYKHTQGIVAEVVTLYVNIQNEALYTASQKITAKLINLVAKNRHGMYLVNRAIESKEKKDKSKYTDIDMDIVNQISSAEQVSRETAESLRQQRENQMKIISAKREGYVSRLLVDMSNMGIFDSLDEVDIKEIAIKIVKSTSVDTDYLFIKQLCAKACIDKNMAKKEKVEASSVCTDKNKTLKKSDKSLLALYDIAEKKGVHPKSMLEKANYIRNPINEFLLGEFI